jgi:hypothetical protein
VLESRAFHNQKKADRIAWGRPKDGKELFGDFSTALRKHIATIDVILAELMLISGQFQMQKPKTDSVLFW